MREGSYITTKLSKGRISTQIVLNAFIPYYPFKMEGLQNLKSMLESGDFMRKLDLKQKYLFTSLERKPCKFIRFRRSGNLFQFLCFDSGQVLQFFTKFLKVPTAALRRINRRIIIHSEDVLFIGHSIEEKIIICDTVIFLL